MGVPKFYRWLSERFPCLSEVINESQIPEFDNLYLDMNGIIHNCSHPNDDDIHFRIPEEEILNNIFSYIDNLFNLIRPQKVFFMAVDGVAPRAKMNQQRARRFMTARTSAEQIRQALANGETVSDEKRFDSNCITPGTYFMTKLHDKLEQWVKKKSTSDPRWHGIKVILSGHNCPGEGEHKIMDFIRSERAKADYDPNTRHCMYGLDADLIMLGIVSHEPHFSLLREEVTFNVRPRKNDKAKKPKRIDSAEKKFHLLHLSLLREYLAWEFSSIKDSLPFAYDMERIVDDWILMGLLVGNDFLPHLPNLHIHDDALPLLYKTYKTVLPTLSGYINEGGYLNLERFEKFLMQLSVKDKNNFVNAMEDEDFMASKRLPRRGGEQVALPVSEVEKQGNEELVPFDSSDIEDNDEEDGQNEEEEETGDAAFVSDDEEEDDQAIPEDDDESSSQIDDVLLLNDDFNDELATLALSGMDDKEFANNVEKCWTKAVSNQFKRHKRHYYSDKLRYKNISKQQLQEQAEGYVRAIQWNLHYYYHGCISWSWFYPHHYAPYISDIRGFSGMKIEFELSSPFRPFEQLLAVLPEASSECLPRPLRELMTSDKSLSPIYDFYPANFETDLNGKRNDWEAVVLIPFIEEKRLLEAIETKESRLTDEERARNSHGPHIMVISHQNQDGQWISTRTPVDKDLYRIPRETVKWGLLPNVKMDVYFPGFPTMKHLKHTGELRYACVNVFGLPSKKESMVLKVENSDELINSDIAVLGGHFCEQEVCVDWPILKLGKIESVWANDKIVRVCPEEGDIIVKDMTEEEKRQWIAHASKLADSLMTRYSIEVEVKKDEKGKTIRPALAWVRNFTGNVYESITDKKGGAPILKAVKQWSNENATRPVLLPLVVKDLLLENSRLLADLPIDKAFPKNSVVWLTNPSLALFGYPGMVSAHKNLGKENCSVEVVGMIQHQKIEELEALRVKKDQKSLRWMPAHPASQQTGVDIRLFGRITGTIFLFNEPREVVERGQQISSDSKINCGLGLKFSRRGLCTADYTDRTDVPNRSGGTNGQWWYSNLTCRLVNEYKKKFPELFQHLTKNQSTNTEDNYYADEIWPNATKRAERFEELKAFLDSLPTRDAEQFSCGTVYADRQLITEIEAIYAAASKKDSELTDAEREVKRRNPPHMMKFWTSPSGVFRYELYDGKVLFDPEADFKILDRVACMSPHAKKPKTVQGVVVGLHDDKVDVLFDIAFEGGSHVRGSQKAAAFRVPRSALLNVTYGLIRKKKQAEEKKETVMDRAYVPLPSAKKWQSAPTQASSTPSVAPPVPAHAPAPQILKKENKPSTSAPFGAPPSAPAPSALLGLFAAASTSAPSQKSARALKNAEKRQKAKEKKQQRRAAERQPSSPEPEPESDEAAEKLTDQLNKLLKIGQRSAPAPSGPSTSSESASTSTSADAPPKKHISMLELLGGKGKDSSFNKKAAEEPVKKENKPKSILEQLKEAQAGNKPQAQQQKKKEAAKKQEKKPEKKEEKKDEKKPIEVPTSAAPSASSAPQKILKRAPEQNPPPPSAAAAPAPEQPPLFAAPGFFHGVSPVIPFDVPFPTMGVPPMGFMDAMAYQQQQMAMAYNIYRNAHARPLTLTDMKPSSTTKMSHRRNQPHNSNKVIIRKSAESQDEPVLDVPPKRESMSPATPVTPATPATSEGPTTSEATPSETTPREVKVRKPKKSRVALFQKRDD